MFNWGTSHWRRQGSLKKIDKHGSFKYRIWNLVQSCILSKSCVLGGFFSFNKILLLIKRKKKKKEFSAVITNVALMEGERQKKL